MQSFATIPSSDTMLASLTKINSNDKTALSQSSGTAFPTTELQVGMACYRTDLRKLYVLHDLTPTWLSVNDLTRPYFCGGLNAGVGSNFIQTIYTTSISGIDNSNTSRLIAQVAGWYFVTARQLICPAARGVYFALRKNGTTVTHAYSDITTVYDLDVSVQNIVYLAVGDYIDFYYAGAAVTSSWSGPHSSVTMQLIPVP